MYLIITQSSIHHAGDERSRTNPGHGYPAYTETVDKVETFSDIAVFKRHVEDYTHRRTSFKAYKAEELKIATKIVIDIE